VKSALPKGSLREVLIMKPKMSDLRKDVRVPLRLEVKLDGMSANSVTSDVSLSGCYILALPHVALGDVLKFHVLLPTNRWMPLKGEVRYQHQNIGFGIKFCDMNAAQQVIVKRLVEGEPTNQNSAALPAPHVSSSNQLFKTARVAHA
jgi:hypothetical protein